MTKIFHRARFARHRLAFEQMEAFVECWRIALPGRAGTDMMGWERHTPPRRRAMRRYAVRSGVRGRWSTAERGARKPSVAVAAAAVAVIVCAGLCAGQAGAGEPALSADQTVKAAGEPFYSNRFEKVPSVAGMTEVGRDLFFDRTLSASGQMSCASCHDPGSAYGPPNDLPVQLGGPDGRLPGL